MQTASGLPWRDRLTDERAALAIAQQHELPELVARILAGRNIALDDVPEFLNPTLRSALPDPFHLRDMDKATLRLLKAIEQKETIAIFGDYDVDGATSVSQLTDYFAALGVRSIAYIPDRMKEGYGPNSAAFEKLIAQGASLIITVDCGTLAFDPIAHAAAKGVDVLVIDHHIGEARLPNAIAVVNPNRVDETSPHTNLCAAGVVFLVLVALNKTLREAGYFSEARKEPNLLPMLDRVALGTVCDVMTLTGLNRAYVAQGLKLLAQRNHIGLRALADVARFDATPAVYHLGFLLGPRINAGGRVGQSDLGIRLLMSANEAEAAALAHMLDQHNKERQAIETMVLEQALEQAETQKNMPVIMLASPNWHEGVIGIVAGRLKEKFARPAIIGNITNGKVKASSRSVTGADIGAATHRAVALGLLTNGGGHAAAAGFSFAEDKRDAVHQYYSEQLSAAVTAYGESRSKLLDGWISVSGASQELHESLKQLEPYGLGFPKPKLAIRDAKIVHRSVLKDKHMKLVLADDAGKSRLNAIAFNVNDTKLGEMLASQQTLHLYGDLNENHWQGQISLQFVIDDAALG
ncbi:MAG: single-stranded-DNA-specific exonuclease RecJ [Alphaproteobacteria bacterium]|nr:single-stranded-DNA-specific exonuclease RecJ [Alphaproteobacteria bacterium]